MAQITEADPTTAEGATPGTASSRVIGTLLWSGGALIVVAAVFAWAWTSSQGEREAADAALPLVAPVPDFALVEASGRSVTRADFLGRVWVADFIFTSCAGPCPQLSLRMNGLQRAIKEQGLDARLVSFSLDPKRDTPGVLREYGQRFRADPDIWWFLTCDNEGYMHRLVENGFLQTVVPQTEDQALLHSNYLVVIDVDGVIRSFHDGLDPAATKRIVQDIERLAGKPSA